MPPPSLGRGLFVLGSLTGPVLFAGAQTKQTRIVSTTGEVKGDLLSEVRVGPWFSGWRMREWASAQTKNLAYSYGYVVRLDGSENAKQEKRTVENETFNTKGTRDGKLTLIETTWRSKKEGDKSGPAGKSRIVPVVGGFTKKKFILVGVGKNNKVEFEALVGIVGDEGNAKAQCWKKFKENSEDKSMREQIQSTFKDGPLLLSEQAKQKYAKDLDGPVYSKQGRALIGNCAQEFYKKREGGGIPFVEQLKGEMEKQIGLQELSIKEGMSIAIAQGLKKKEGDKEDIITPGILVKNQFNDGSKTLWVGLQGDGKAKMDKVKTQYRARGQGWVALLDWHSTKSEERLQGIKGKTNEVKKITLDKGRRYFLWDPSYTHIKNGKLITVDGQNIPWNVHIELPYKTELVK